VKVRASTKESRLKQKSHFKRGEAAISEPDASTLNPWQGE
jgi:hypothetical protein